jgi:hypothetical protein
LDRSELWRENLLEWCRDINVECEVSESKSRIGVAEERDSWNPEERENPELEAVAKELVKTQHTEKT